MENNDEPILTFIRCLKNNSIDRSTITVELRRDCIELLMYDGLSVSQIAELFKVSDKTIKRDLSVIYERNALKPSVELYERLVGHFYHQSLVHHAQIVRRARSNGISDEKKGALEYMAFKVLSERMEILQGLGYCPKVPTQIIADFMHHESVDEQIRPEDLRKKIDHVEILIKQYGDPSGKLNAMLQALRIEIQEIEVKKKISNIETQIKEQSHEQDHQ